MNNYPKEFLKSYIRWVWDELDKTPFDMKPEILRNDRIMSMDVNTILDKYLYELEKFFFDSFIGQKIIEIYYQMNDKKVELTNTNDIWVDDEVFGEVISEVIREMSDES